MLWNNLKGYTNLNWNPKTRQSKKVGFRVLIYKEVQMKRKPYTVQEKEILLQSIAIEKLQIVVQLTKKDLSCLQLENIKVEKLL